jgi:Lambda phage tail tube protein, TTP
MPAQLGYGIEVRFGATAAAATASILLGGCTNAPFPPVTRAKIDVTAHDSPNGLIEYMPGMKEVGEIALEINLVPGNATHDHIRLMQDVAMNAQADFLVELTYATAPGTPKCTFRAFVLGFEGPGPVTEQLTGTLTLQPITIPAWTGV